MFSLIKKLFVTLVFFVALVPMKAAAKPLPFMPNKRNDGTITPVSSDSFFGGIKDGLGSLVAPMYSWGVTIITTLFVIGTLVMILSVLFKNGQWQKYAQQTMLISFVVMLVLRGLPIVILSIQSAEDIDILLKDSVNALSASAVFLGVISIAVSFLFRFGYRLIEHPEYHRWSKTLLSVSILMMIFAVIIPYLFPVI